MKLLLLTLLLTAAPMHAGWFGNDDEERHRQYELKIQQERESKGSWQFVAGVFAIGSVVLFTVGTALGSRTRRHGKQ